MTEQDRVVELTWIFRPAPTRPAPVQALGGRPIYATGRASRDGEAEMVLGDGTHLCASTAEIVAEQRLRG